MKKILPILTLIFLASCQIQNITDAEKENVILKLENMMKIDQEYAGIPSKELKEKYGNEKSWEIFQKKRDSVAIDNQIKAKEIFKKYGFVGTKNFSEDASSNFWIIIQHADNDVKLQEKILKFMNNEIKKNNAFKSQYAMLEDRVNVNKGNSQRFGSQVTYNKYGQAIPKNGLLDSLNIEKLRKEYELPSFKEYYNDMTEMHFDMNKESYISQGITQPKLYK
ncbi:DUF6624 domain-containing protein [Chryseobacterium scophthalmum]|jgi:hypothetical protein|uniref:DUF6624 domain-containing protein n=1 Tax=Chryseobacterium TaxID=59732 RepID=UPI001E4EB497|nr:DUF6624 domain-containing protein [Chryseobacterium sp. LC2016-27]MCD0457065.1 hypothetical protein [Chryseobacterium sp. LC2016-27]